MQNDRIYLRRGYGLVMGAMVAWALMTASDLLPPVLFELFDDASASDAQSNWPAQAIGMLSLYAVFGIPAALVATVTLGAIAWKIADESGANDRRAAVKVGGAIGAVLGVLSLLFTLILGLRTQADASYNYES